MSRVVRSQRESEELKKGIDSVLEECGDISYEDLLGALKEKYGGMMPVISKEKYTARLLRYRRHHKPPKKH